ncbi:MAG TPA: glycine cleavage T C-terminal barrel domain-containing protein [Longimicrobiales bacterium]
MRNFGNPAAEYEAAVNKAVVHERTDRALLRVYGRDPVRIVQGIVTNDVANLPPDRVAYAALLTPKGRMVADLRVIRRGDELLLDVPTAALDELLALFKRTIPPLFARFENVTASYALVGVYGPASHAVLATAIGSATDIPDTAGLPSQDGYAAAGDILFMTTTDAGVPGVELLIPIGRRDDVLAAIIQAGAVQVGDTTIDVLRIEAGTPRWGAELDETTIPLEADLQARAISTNKGCYTGQEVIIRVLHRGHVNRHLRRLLLGDVATPGRGTELYSTETGRVVGAITSAAWSPKHNQVIALGYVRREIEPPAELRLGDAGGSVVNVENLQAGAPA